MPSEKIRDEFKQWLADTTFLPGYTPINGVTTNLMEMAFTAGAEAERSKITHKLQEMRRMGEQKDDPRMANEAESMLDVLGKI